MPGNTNTDYTHSFQIPASKDWVFRGRKSQGELKENHPDVTRIHVADRSTATPTTAGYDVVKLTIRGKDRQTVMDCYEEGRQKILDSMAYDAEKAEKKRMAKAKRADNRHFQKARELEKKHAPKVDVDADVHGGSVLLQKAMAAIKAKEVDGKGKGSKEDQEMDQFASVRNGFAGLDIEESTSHEHEQAEANLRKQQRMMAQPKVNRQPIKPALSGWAKMASKAPVVEAAPSHEVKVVHVPTRKRKAVKAVMDWAPLPEGTVSGWDAEW